MPKHLLLGALAAAGVTAATFITASATGSAANTITFVHVQTPTALAGASRLRVDRTAGALTRSPGRASV